MPNISRKIELLAASDHLHDLVKTYAFSSDDDTNALQNIFRASLEVSYLAQTQKDWALRILTQPVLSVATRVAIDTKWFLELADGNPKTAAEIARATSTETGLLIRLMRVLAAEGLVDEVGVSTYAANEKTRFFMEPLHEDMARNWFDNVTRPLSSLPTYLSNTSYTQPTQDSLGPYSFTYGTTSWRRFEAIPSLGTTFNNAMTVVKRAERSPFIHKYPLMRILRQENALCTSSDEVLIVDVGGGIGYHLQQFRAATDDDTDTAVGATNGTDTEFTRPIGRLILQDLPHVLPSPTNNPTLHDHLTSTLKITLQPHDFFTPQPVPSARVYNFSAILHNWPDPLCLRILQNTVPAMGPHSRILIQDYIVPDIGASTAQVGFDMTMMAVLCGRERSLGEWEQLVTGAGLVVRGVYGGKDGGVGILECVLGGGGRAGT